MPRKIDIRNLRIQNTGDVKRLIRGGISPHKVIAEVRVSRSMALFSPSIHWALSVLSVRTRTFHQPFPKSPSTLKLNPLFPVATLDRELRWAEAYLGNYIDALRGYATRAETFRRVVLLGEFTKAEEYLDDIEKELGHSLWLIKQRLVLRQLSGGLEDNKAYLKRVRSQLRVNGIAPYIAYETSVRCEPNVQYTRNGQRIVRQLKTYRLPPGTEGYLHYHLIPEWWPPEATEVAAVLANESQAPVIDYFEATVWSLATLAACNQVSAEAVSACETLLKGTGDARLIGVMELLGGQRIAPGDEQGLCAKALQSMLSGMYEQAMEEGRQALVLNPESGQAYIITAWALACAGSHGSGFAGTPSSESVRRLATVLRFEAGSIEDLFELKKFAVNHISTGWGMRIAAVLDDLLFPTDRPLIAQEFALGAALGGGIGVLGLLRIPASSSTRSLATALSPDQPTRELAQLARAIALGDVQSLPEGTTPEWALLLAHFTQAVGDNRKQLVHARVLLESRVRPLRIAGLRLTASAMLALDEVEQLVQLLVEALVSEEHLYNILPLRAAGDRVSSLGEGSLRGKVGMAVFYDLYSRFVGSDLDSSRAFSCEECLQAGGVSKPSELLSKAGGPLDSTWLYFYQHVCRESVLDNLDALRSSREVAEERRTICQALSTLDAANVDAYQMELQDIIRRLMIRRRMQEVQQSRIFVDLEGIARALGERLRESFARYKELRKHSDVGTLLLELRKQIIHALDAGSPTYVSIQLPLNEASELLGGMFEDVRDEFLSGADHGLDGYLSVRIRHGTLVGHLRRPLENARLVTQQRAGTGEYQDNAYWLEKLQPADDVARRSATKLLARFSRRFDELVEEMRSGWIQVRRPGSSEGMFVVSSDPSTIAAVGASVTDETDVSSFIDICLAVCMKNLQNSLDQVTKRFETEAKRRLAELLSELQLGLSGLQHSLLLGDITTAIGSAGTALTVAVDRAKEWFSLSKETPGEPFAVEEVVAIGEESVRITTARQFSVRLNVAPDLENIQLKGVFLYGFMDILFTAFENVVRHSGAEPPAADVRVWLQDKALCFAISNAVEGDGASEESRMRVEGGGRLRGVADYSLVAREGGTGFYKIRKTLEHDFGTGSTLQVSQSSDNRFQVTFAIPITRVRL